MTRCAARAAPRCRPRAARGVACRGAGARRRARCSNAVAPAVTTAPPIRARRRPRRCAAARRRRSSRASSPARCARRGRGCRAPSAGPWPSSSPARRSPATCAAPTPAAAPPPISRRPAIARARRAGPGGARRARTRAFSPAADAGLTAADVPKLTLKWAFGFPDASVAWSQPTVAGGRVFVGSQNGTVYALDARTGCIRWTFAAQGGVRTAVAIDAAPAHRRRRASTSATPPPTSTRSTPRPAASCGCGKRRRPSARARHRVADAARGPALRRRLVVRGSAGRRSAVRLLHVPRQRQRARRRRRAPWCGRRRSSPIRCSGAAPAPPACRSGGRRARACGRRRPSTPRRRWLYVATGNAYSAPAAPTSNAVVALDLQSGTVRWMRQVTPGDVYVSNCRPGNPNCPDVARPRRGLRQPADADAHERGPRPDRDRPEVRPRLRARSRQRGRHRLAVPRRAWRPARRHRVGLGGGRRARVFRGVGRDASAARRTARGDAGDGHGGVDGGAAAAWRAPRAAAAARRSRPRSR